MRINRKKGGHLAPLRITGFSPVFECLSSYSLLPHILFIQKRHRSLDVISHFLFTFLTLPSYRKNPLHLSRFCPVIFLLNDFFHEIRCRFLSTLLVSLSGHKLHYLYRNNPTLPAFLLHRNGFLRSRYHRNHHNDQYAVP